jgi:hypothetical protein
VRAALLSTVLLVACQGQITQPSKSEGLPPQAVPPSEVPPVEVKPEEPWVCATGPGDAAGPRMLRRLTTPEWEASVRFALAAAPAASTLPPDAAAKNGFTNNAERLVVNDTFADRLFESAKAAAVLASTEPQLSTLLPCAKTGGEACARSYLGTVGRRVYRRPLTEPEVQRYLSLYAKVVPKVGFAAWVKWATVALLQSPHAVYRSELGSEAGALSSYEIASALAFTYTGAPPDDALLNAAATAGLDSRDQVVATARRLVLDDAGAVRPKAKEMLLAFARQWANLSKLDVLTKRADKYPQWNEGVRASMRQEIEGFFTRVVADQKGTVADLLTAPYTLVDSNLAGYYGFGTAGTGLQLTQRPAKYGVGFLAQGAVLAIRANSEASSPTQRGAFVRSHLLCVDPPPPPPNIGALPAPTATNTTRERYEMMHAASSGCAGCHKGIDPIGFALEHFDSAGRYRDTENGFPINDAALLTLEGKEISFTGATELANFVAQDKRSSSCLAAYVASFAFGLDHHEMPCLASTPTAALSSGGSIVEYFISLAGTPHFRQRAN